MKTVEDDEVRHSEDEENKKEREDDRGDENKVEPDQAN